MLFCIYLLAQKVLLIISIDSMMIKRLVFVAFVAFALVGVTACSNGNKKPEEPQPEELGVRKIFTITDRSEENDFAYTGVFKGAERGKSTTFSFPARKGQSLVFTTKFSATKDWFVAPTILFPLFNEDGTPNTGDLTDYISVWDANLFDASEQRRLYPPASPVRAFWVKSDECLKFSLSYNEPTGMFTATLTNKTQAGKSWNGVFSPGVYSVKNVDPKEDPFSVDAFRHYFLQTRPANPAFEEYILSGNFSELLSQVKAGTGLNFTFSDPVVVVYQGEGHPIFQLGEKDRGQGIKELIQNGDVKKLAESLRQVKGVRQVYTDRVQTMRLPDGAKVYYVIGLRNTNDWFLANIEPVGATDGGFMGTQLFDLGVAKDEIPGAGAHQGLYGGKPQPESNPIKLVKTSYPIPSVDKIIEVWLKKL